VAVLVVQRVERTRIADVAVGVAVCIGLVRVRDGGAVVVVRGLGRVEPASRTDSVAVLVVLRVARARVARVAEAVAVCVGLVRVRDSGAVVVLGGLGRAEAAPRADSVAILIVQRVVRAGIARIAERVSVGIGLAGIGDGGAVVVLAGLGRVE